MVKWPAAPVSTIPCHRFVSFQSQWWLFIISQCVLSVQKVSLSNEKETVESALKYCYACFSKCDTYFWKQYFCAEDELSILAKQLKDRSWGSSLIRCLASTVISLFGATFAHYYAMTGFNQSDLVLLWFAVLSSLTESSVASPHVKLPRSINSKYVSC